RRVDVARREDRVDAGNQRPHLRLDVVIWAALVPNLAPDGAQALQLGMILVDDPGRYQNSILRHVCVPYASALSVPRGRGHRTEGRLTLSRKAADPDPRDSVAPA